MDWRLATNAIHALNDCFGASFMFTTLHIHSNKVGVALEVNLNFGGNSVRMLTTAGVDDPLPLSGS